MKQAFQGKDTKTLIEELTKLFNKDARAIEDLCQHRGIECPELTLGDFRDDIVKY